MNKIFLLAVSFFFFLPFILEAQQQVTVISRCGGTDTLTIPTIVDNDLDGMDDALEQKLLNYFMPTLIQFDDESCPGPALNGTGDSNLIVCHIYPVPQQYCSLATVSLVLTQPVAIVPSGGLATGLVWYNPLIKINTALLYGKDCGLSGHTADVEGFNFSLKYIGSDTATGWMYDTVMQHWMGGTIQTVSHAGTLCEQVETLPYKSALFPAGVDTVYASPDKHGNYLTISGCGSSFICNPGCGGIPSKKNVKNINIGEPAASLVADLGTVYAAYAGNDPWGNSNFLAANSGNAGAIRDKMLLPLASNFISGLPITSQAQICDIYSQCFSTGSAYLDYTCNGSPYFFYTQQLTTAGVYYQTLTSSLGCDSTIELTLSVYPASSTSIQATICRGSNYDFGGLSLTIPGDYVDSLTNISGCDSIVQVTLSVDTLPAVSWSFNADSIDINGQPILLTGALPIGGIYSGPGVIDTFFYPDSAGAGTHVITYTYIDSAGCSDSVKINVDVIVTGIREASYDNSLRLYPNPVKDVLQLFLSGNSQPLAVSIYNVEAVLTKEIILSGESGSVNISTLPKGFYTVEIKTKANSFIRKLTIQ